jgi:hypothetical protein
MIRHPPVRFSSDYAKPVKFYVDEQFVCSVRANPEGNNEYCDAQIPQGEHTVSAEGEGLAHQSCKIDIVELDGWVNLTKAGRLNCFSSARPD